MTKYKICEFLNKGFSAQDFTNIPCKRCGEKDNPLLPNYVCINCATKKELKKYK